MWTQSRLQDRVIIVLLILAGMGFCLQGSNLLFVAGLLLIIIDRAKIQLCGGMGSFLLLCVLFVSYYITATFYGYASLTVLGCPIAFYIGNRIDNPTEKTISKLIVMLTFAMASHIVLNLVYELAIFGTSVFTSARHYDIWSHTFSTATGVMTNGTMLAALVFYLIFLEKNRFISTVGVALLIIVTVYDLVLGGRTYLYTLLIAFVLGIILQLFCSEDMRATFAVLGRILIVVIVFVTVAAFIFYSYREQISEFIEGSYFYHRFFYKSAYQQGMMETGRFERRFNFIPHMLDYPFGGNHARQIVGGATHELWMDVYDKAGIIPYVSLIIYSLTSVRRFISVFRNKFYSVSFRIMVITMCIVLNIQFFLEPIMDGSPMVLFFYCLIDGALIKLLNSNYQVDGEVEV